MVPKYNARVQHRRDTSANWTAENPVLLDGEIIVVVTEAGEVRHKTGDGVKTYTQLPFDDEVVRNLVNNKADAEHAHDDMYYTEAEIDGMEFISTDDIDAICGTIIQDGGVNVTFNNCSVTDDGNGNVTITSEGA